MRRISLTNLASARWRCAGPWTVPVAQVYYADLVTPAARQAAATGNPAAFWASTQR